MIRVISHLWQQLLQLFGTQGEMPFLAETRLGVALRGPWRIQRPSQIPQIFLHLPMGKSNIRFTVANPVTGINLGMMSIPKHHQVVAIHPELGQVYLFLICPQTHDLRCDWRLCTRSCKAYYPRILRLARLSQSAQAYSTYSMSYYIDGIGQLCILDFPDSNCGITCGILLPIDIHTQLYTIGQILSISLI